MKTPLFEIEVKGKNITLLFKNIRPANTFGRMEFYSRLLHSLVPDGNRIWRSGKRLEAEISGWPKYISWERTGELSFAGKINNGSDFSLSQYTQLLEGAMTDILDGELSPAGSSLYRISIGNGSEWLEYRFHGKGRTIAALCVLYDLQPHPRNDLEINIPKNLAIKEWPTETSEELQRTYGDPSKTADELRNEGWPRFGEGASMKVFRERVGGQIQQMYQITQKDQSLDSQMMRSAISKKWRDALFESQDYTCQICLNKYEPELLEPDHRIPVIYEADRLTDENFKDKLMTLCRYCNQQKRETTKRLPPDYDWKSSPWAYPEKFDTLKVRQGIERIAKRKNISTDEVLDLFRK